MELAADVIRKWMADKIHRLAAALAFYTVFSLPPLLLLVIAIAGQAFGREAATGQIVGQFEGLIGTAGGEVIEDLVLNASREGSGMLATIISVITLFIGASGVFIGLQDALNTIWGVMPKPGLGIMSFLRHRLLSFAMVIGIGFLLMVSLVVTTALAAFGDLINNAYPAGGPALQVLNTVVAFAITTGIFAAMFKFLPDVIIPWRGVWIGALTTSVLFSVGKYLIGLYLGNSSTASVYGAAGSLVVLLMWVYYSAQIFLTGAVITAAYSERMVPVEADPKAMPVTPESRAREGLPEPE